MLADKMVLRLEGKALPLGPGIAHLVMEVHGLEEYLAWINGLDFYSATA